MNISAVQWIVQWGGWGCARSGWGCAPANKMGDEEKYETVVHLMETLPVSAFG